MAGLNLSIAFKKHWHISYSPVDLQALLLRASRPVSKNSYSQRYVHLPLPMGFGLTFRGRFHVELLRWLSSLALITLQRVVILTGTERNYRRVKTLYLTWSRDWWFVKPQRLSCHAEKCSRNYDYKTWRRFANKRFNGGEAIRPNRPCKGKQK